MRAGQFVLQIASGIVWARSIWWGFDLASRQFPESFTAPVFAATISAAAFPVLDYVRRPSCTPFGALRLRSPPHQAEQAWFSHTAPDSYDARLYDVLGLIAKSNDMRLTFLPYSAVKLSFLGGCVVWLTQRPTSWAAFSLLLHRTTSELSLGTEMRSSSSSSC